MTAWHYFMKELTGRSIETWVLLWSLPLNMCVTRRKLLILYILQFSAEKEKKNSVD